MPKYITDIIFFDEKNSDEQNSDKKNIVKKILMKSK